MKKIYTFLTWMVALMVCATVAEAKTITLTIDNPQAASYRDPNNNYEPGQWNEANSAVFELTDDIYIPLTTNTGYELLSAKVGDTVLENGPASSISINTALVEDGATVYITTGEKQPKVLKIIGDPERVYVEDNSYRTWGAEESVDGAWTISLTEEWGNVNVYAKSGYLLSSVTDDKGNNYLYSSPANSSSIYVSSLPSGTTVVTVEAKSEDELYDGNITVNVLDGTPYQVAFRFASSGYYGVDLVEGENILKFDRSTAFPVTIEHGYNSSYNPQSLYKVTVNGEAIEAVDRVYTIQSLENGDVVDVYVNPPATDINVSVLFENEESKAALKDVRCNGNLIDPADYPSFAAQTGQTLVLDFDTSSYNVSLTENDVPVSVSYYGDYTHKLANENGYVYKISATPITPYTVTVVCENWEHLILSHNYSGLDPYTLTGVESTITLMPADNYTYIKAAEGWIVKSAKNADTGEEYQYGTVYLEDGMTLFVELEEFIRDKHFTLYTEPDVWNYLQLTLSVANNDVRKEITPEPGYSTIEYNDADRPFSISGYDNNYGAPEVFLNDVLCENNYGSLPALAEVQEGDVIKIMTQNAPRHTVTYTAEEGAQFAVVHDLTRTVDHTVSHDVHTGTEIHIVPAEAGTIKVKAGETELEADSEGKFVHTVTAPVEIAISKVEQSSIIDIEGNSSELVDVYNLQGVCVRRAATPADINTLPAGVYISAGKKFVVK